MLNRGRNSLSSYIIIVYKYSSRRITFQTNAMCLEMYHFHAANLYLPKAGFDKKNYVRLGFHMKYGLC